MCQTTTCECLCDYLSVCLFDAGTAFPHRTRSKDKMTIDIVRTARVKWIFSFVAILVFSEGHCRRYRYCSDGCCPEEYCAFHTICYPKIKCTFGCPDGHCVEGICMPENPCTEDTSCDFAFTCTMNYNLGYDACQYNLDIGKTLCLDTNGNSLAKPES